MQYLKQQYFRSIKHLKNVASLPCQVCGIEGQTQAAHSNWVQWGGKCKSKKASDEFTAALCQHCHYEIDQGGKLEKSERQKIWLAAHKQTVRKLQELGLWPVDVPLPEGL